VTYLTFDLTIGDHVKLREVLGEMIAEQTEKFIRTKLMAAGLQTDDYILTVGGD
jgi:hypothetical protein